VQGVNVTALREIKLLKELQSPFLVKLIDVFPHKRNLLLVCAQTDRSTPPQGNPKGRLPSAQLQTENRRALW
jgi:hypothetical protein